MSKKPESDAKQKTLFGFFSKSTQPAPSSSASTSSQASKAKNGVKTATGPKSKAKTATSSEAAIPISSDVEDAAVEKSASFIAMQKAKAEESAPSSLQPTSAATSEGDLTNTSQMDVDSDDESPVRKPGRRLSKKRSVVEEGSSDEEADKSARLAMSKKPRLSAKPSSKGKSKSTEEDDFLANTDQSASEGTSGPAIHESPASEDEAPKEKTKPKKTAKPAQSKLSVPKPPIKRSGSNSSTGTLSKATDKRKDLVESKAQANKDMFGFLRDVRDADGNRVGDEDYDPRTLQIPTKYFEKMTPFEKQFWNIKKNHYDTVLFFQKGKFYELYEDDANIGHQEFDLKLTDRVKMKMVGVPEASFDFWAAKFLARGYKVGRVDQSETALGAEMRKAAAKGKKAGPKEDKIVGRELKSVFTSGTLTDTTEETSEHCISIKEYIESAHAPPRIGVCVLDASTAGFDISAFEDDISRTKLETLLRQFRPREIICEKGNLSPSTMRVVKNIVDLRCLWTYLKPRTEFLSAEDALVAVKNLFTKTPKATEGDSDHEMDGEDQEPSPLPPAIEAVKDQAEAMSALGGMLSHLKQLNLDQDLCQTRNFNSYDPMKNGQCLVLDGQTLAHIEVLQNSSGTDEGTLYKLVNRCVSPFGKRLLKGWLIQPLLEVGPINARLDAVEELMNHPSIDSMFVKACAGLLDLERVLSRICAGKCKAVVFLKLLSNFSALSKFFVDVKEEDAELKSAVLQRLVSRTPSLASKLKTIKKTFIEEDGVLVPNEGADEEYDAILEEIRSIEEQLGSTLSKYKKELKDSSMIFKDIGTKDIYQVQCKKGTEVPDDWTQMSSTKDFTRYYSPKIEKLVRKLKEARENRTTLRSSFQAKLYAAFSEDYPFYKNFVLNVAELDCLLSLAKTSQNMGEPAVRPEFVEGDHAFVAFEELRHPCLLTTDVDFIPNDVTLGKDHQQMMLLTGPNMAGKSTMLRMTSAAVIMAQIGCYVPAQKAVICPADRIVTRMGANDYIFQNASTFKVEMDDCKKILDEATPKSLVVLDELGRGTATFDGLSIAFSVLHHLATHVGCIGFFSTHYNSLVEDFRYHSQVRPCHMQTLTQDDTITFLYKLVDGATEKSYGSHVARLAGVAEPVVQRAIEMSAAFEEQSKKRELESRKDEGSLPLPFQADASFLFSLIGENAAERDTLAFELDVLAASCIQGLKV